MKTLRRARIVERVKYYKLKKNKKTKQNILELKLLVD